MRETVRILGIDIDNIDVEEAGKITKDLIENSNKSCKVIVAPNTEFIMMAQKDEEFYNILRGADLATPDSVGVMIGGKLQKKPFKQRIPGQMYFRKVLEVGEKEGWTFYLLGGKDDVPELATENIKKLYPNIKIVGYHEGFFEQDSEEDVIKATTSLIEKLNEKINNDDGIEFDAENMRVTFINGKEVEIWNSEWGGIRNITPIEE